MSRTEHDAAAGAGLALAEALFDAHALIGAVQHQLRAIENDDVLQVSCAAHDAGRVLRLAAGTVHELAALLMDARVTALPGTQEKLQALLSRQGGAA